jgi:hypothetical protein
MRTYSIESLLIDPAWRGMKAPITIINSDGIISPVKYFVITFEYRN